MDAEKLMDRGHQLAIAASMRVLAAHVALIANPKDPGQWFTTLGQNAFEYVDAYLTRSLMRPASRLSKRQPTIPFE